jgi:uncharacterized protein
MYNVFVISGGTGFIGSALTKKLVQQGAKVYILTRTAKPSSNALIEYIQWNPAAQTITKAIPETNVCVVHLAGAGVADKRWNDARKQEIVESRTKSTAYLHQLLKSKTINAAQIISASAIGIYANTENIITEESTIGSDFLAQTCIAWEKGVHAMNDLQIPISILRIGLVMGAGGGAITEFVKTMRFHIAGIPGSGTQLYSWVHVQDIVGMILHCATHKLNDTYNAVSPTVVTCKTLITSLAKAYCGWYIPAPAPSFIIKIMLGEMSTEVLKSANISSAKIVKNGYQFLYANVDAAMQEIAKELKK